MNLKARVVKASLWSVAGGAGQQATSFIVFLYLARVLDPAAIGLVAFAAVLLDIITSVVKLGSVEALQRQSPDRKAESALLALLAITGTAGSALLVAAAFMARFAGYGAQLATIFLLLAPISLLQALNSVPEALLRRDLNFRPLTIRTWIGTFAGALTALFMVKAGFGVYALVGQRVAQVLASMLLLWSHLSWRPIFSLNLKPALPTAKLGIQVLVASLAGLLNARIADLITGAFLGPAALGLQRMGWRFMDVMAQMAILPLTTVALTTFSKLKDDRVALGRAYLRMMQFVAIATLPAFFGIGAIAHPVIQLILGDKWIGAVPVFQILGVLMMAGSVNYFFSPIMVACGRVDIVMKQSAIQIIICVPLLWLGAKAGLVGVLTAHAVRAWIVAAFNVSAVERVVGVSRTRVLGSILPSAICSIAMCTVIWIFIDTNSPNAMLTLITSIPIGVITYFITLLAGDFLGLWPRYFRGSVAFFTSIFQKARN